MDFLFNFFNHVFNNNFRDVVVEFFFASSIYTSLQVIESLHKSSTGNDSTNDAKGANIELNSVAEFCRTLGDIPTYGMSGNRDEEADEMMVSNLNSFLISIACILKRVIIFLC